MLHFCFYPVSKKIKAYLRINFSNRIKVPGLKFRILIQ